MDLVVFENNKPYVIDEFREGRIDYVELASDVAETKFFQFLFSDQIVEKLGQSYPSPRDRHHVPLWMYVCSQLSLRLHGHLSRVFIDFGKQTVQTNLVTSFHIGVSRAHI